MYPIRTVWKEPVNGRFSLIINRINELQQKADKNIIIALCGNKIDLEERNVTYEVRVS